MVFHFVHKAFLLSLLFYLPSISYSQQNKREMEKPIQLIDLPENIRLVIEYLVIKEARYFQETDGKSKTYEVKFKKSNYLWSAEFDSVGKLMDIEILIPFDKLPDFTKTRVSQFFSDNYTSFRLTRAQIQYTVTSHLREDFTESLAQLLKGNSTDFDCKYEIQAEVTNGDIMGEYEFLFSSEGKLITQKKIERRDIDNIWY